MREWSFNGVSGYSRDPKIVNSGKNHWNHELSGLLRIIDNKSLPALYFINPGFIFGNKF
jgi:hypothetical protein